VDMLHSGLQFLAYKGHMDKDKKITDLTVKEAQEILVRGVFTGTIAVALLYFGISAAISGFFH